MTSRAQITIPQEQIEAFCMRHHIHRLSLFGSVLTNDFRPDSDVDVLVEFAPGFAPGLAFFGMQEELSAIFGREVDLNTLNFLSPHFREQVRSSAEERYVAA
jgi:predicted nucleotidyltransferase